MVSIYEDMRRTDPFGMFGLKQNREAFDFWPLTLD